MKSFVRARNLQWLQLIIILLLGSLIHGNPGSLTSGSHTIDLNHPTSQPSNLINPSLGEEFLKIPNKCIKNQKPTAVSLRLAEFDLNELPEDTGSEVSFNHGKGKSVLESDRYYGQTSKSQMIEPAHRTLSPTDYKSSSTNIVYVSKKPASDQIHLIIESDFVRDSRYLYANQVLKNQPERRYDQKDKIQHSPITLGEKYSSSSKTSSTDYVAKSRKRKKADGTEVKYLFSEIKGKNKIMISSTEKGKFKVNKNLTEKYLDHIRNSLSAEIKNPGPFDIQGEKRYSSPYNKNLLGFIENNIENILSSELGNIRINKDFLETTKKFFWNVEEDLFFLSEENFNKALIFVDSKSHGANSQRWIERSKNSNQFSSSVSSISKICFSTVFTNFFTYDKLSRFLLNDKMRQTADAKFLELNSKLSNLKKGGVRIRRGAGISFLKQTWFRMTSFLAYVHALNAIISPGHSKPLSNEQLVKHQEGAIEFFFQLHDNVDFLFTMPKDTKLRNISLKPFSEKSDFEEEKQKAMKEILSSNIRSDNASWLYIELWMFKYRPSLYKIMKRGSTSGRKFRSLTNRVFLLLFSGMYSYKILIE
ncbi:hypothetical protein BY996DRAFT_6724008 [Phakopsora pachyrhizi]|nr:hypothetical protein BY996DRAFT_6724008 [Phakopsora pachyrhizi]